MTAPVHGPTEDWQRVEASMSDGLWHFRQKRDERYSSNNWDVFSAPFQAMCGRWVSRGWAAVAGGQTCPRCVAEEKRGE